MPDNVKISELTPALQIADSAIFPHSQDNGGTNTTFGAPMTQIGSKVAEGLTFSNLTTTSKTLVGAINELKPVEVTGTLTAGNTSITLSSVAITSTSTIQVFTDLGEDYTSITVTTGSVTLTFDEQANDMGVKVRVS